MNSIIIFFFSRLIFDESYMGGFEVSRVASPTIGQSVAIESPSLAATPTTIRIICALK